MKFQYKYRTRENVELLGEIAAKDRDAAFAALKAQGIKPGKLWEAPGLANKVLGKGKRWIAIGVLGALCLVLVLTLNRTKTELKVEKADNPNIVGQVPRHQIYGDPMIIAKGLQTDWAECGLDEGEKILARFAQPGTSAIIPGNEESAARAVEACLTNKLVKVGGELLEYAQLKSIVESMKDEARQFLKDGDTIRGYLAAIIERQKQEIAFYNAAKQDVDAAKETMSEEALLDYWSKKNAELRAIGVRAVPFPGEE